MHGWQGKPIDGPNGGWSCAFWSGGSGSVMYCSCGCHCSCSVVEAVVDALVAAIL